MHHYAKFHQDQPKGFVDIVIFQFSRWWLFGHCGFSKIQIFSSQSGWEGQYASSYQISSKSVKQL